MKRGQNGNLDITSADYGTVTAVEWFFGYGGNALGLKRAIPGLQSVAVCERDAFVVANVVAKMEAGLLDAVPIWTDVTDFPTEPFGYQQLDFFAASYPCQGFSHAGKRLGVEDHRHLWPYCRKFIRAVRPGWVWLENVEGHVTLGLSTVLADLEEDGYTAAWGIFSASEVGAPHQRKRVFILAYRAQQLRHGSGELQGRGSEYPNCGTNELALCDGIGCSHGESKEQPAEAGVNAQRDIAASGGEDVAHSTNSGWREDRMSTELRTEMSIQSPGNGWADNKGEGYKVGEETVWPSRPGERQYAWEPPRVVGQSTDKGQSVWGRREVGGQRAQKPQPERPNSDKDGTERQTQSPLGGNLDGPSDGLDFPRCTGLSDTELAEIREWMVKGTNRTDELRMCGNGVVPQTAERAFRVLHAELTGSTRADEALVK